MIKVNVLSEEKSWEKRIKKKNLFFNNLCKFFPKKYTFNNRQIYLTLLLSNNRNIKKLNKKFRKKNKHTDVLSFPFQQDSKIIKNFYLGDIIISFEYMNKPSQLTNYEFKEKVIKIFIHGFLHLLGFDHTKEKEYRLMIGAEKKIFEKIRKHIK